MIYPPDSDINKKNILFDFLMFILENLHRKLVKLYLAKAGVHPISHAELGLILLFLNRISSLCSE